MAERAGAGLAVRAAVSAAAPRAPDSAVPAPSRGRRRLFAALLAVLVLALCAVLTEVALRVRERLRAPPRLALMTASPHGTGSYRLAPGLDLTARVGGREIPITTNRHGMRWPEVARAPTPGRARVAFVGDSFTFGSWSDSAASSFVGTFAARVPAARFETLGFGVGGYGLDDVELLLAEEVLAFAPRYVVIVFFNGNDFRDTYLGLDKYRLVDGTLELDAELLARKVPARFHDPDRRRQRAALPAWTRLRLALSDRLALYRTALHLRQELRTRRRTADESAAPPPLFTPFAVEQRFTAYTFWSQVPYPPVAEAARDVSLATLERTVAALRAQGVEPLLAALPYRAQLYAADLAGDGYDLALPQRHVEQLTATRGVPYLDLLPLLRARIERSGEELYVDGDPHFNDAGHRAVGELLAAWFLARERSPRPAAPRTGASDAAVADPAG